MRNIFMASLALALLCSQAHAAPAFTGEDYSGVYACTGDDAHEGKYQGTVTLKLNPAQSTGPYAAYEFILEVPGFGTYRGEAAGEGDRLGIHFALDEPGTTDHGVGIATLRRDPEGRLGFRKYYYEREYKGGNHGIEDCVRK